MVAVYYDVENLMEYKNYELAISKVKERVANLEAIQFAYAEWGRFDSNSRELFMSNGISMKQVVNGVGYFASIKNISDIAITVDVMEILFKNTKIDHYILVSGDGGFIPLVMKLREFGKKVSIIALKENMSKNIISYANDHFIIDETEETKERFTHEEDVRNPNRQTQEIEYEHYQKTIWAIMCSSKSGHEAVTNIFKSKEIKSRIQEHGLSKAYLVKTYYKTCYDNPDRQELSKDFKKSLKQKIKLSYSEQDGIIFPKGQIVAKPEQEAESLSDEDVRNICKKYGLSFSVSEISKNLFSEIIENKEIYILLNQDEMADLLFQNTKRSRAYCHTVAVVISLLEPRKKRMLYSANYKSLLSGAIASYINDVSRTKAHVNKKHIAGMLKWDI